MTSCTSRCSSRVRRAPPGGRCDHTLDNVFAIEVKPDRFFGPGRPYCRLCKQFVVWKQTAEQREKEWRDCMDDLKKSIRFYGITILVIVAMLGSHIEHVCSHTSPCTWSTIFSAD